MAKSKQVQIIEQAAKAHGIPAALLYGVWGQESNFATGGGSLSPKGAQGPFQFMPGTAASLGIDPHNFKQAANGAAQYLAQYKSRGTKGMLAAYNAGPAGNPHNAETQAYIPKVLHFAQQYMQTHGGNLKATTTGSTSATVTQADIGGLGSFTPGKPETTDVAGAIRDSLLTKVGGGLSSVKKVGKGGILAHAMDLIHSGQYTTPGTPAKSTMPTGPTLTTTSSKTSKSTGGGGGNAKGTVVFDGKPVLAKFAAELRWARKNGWKGTVTSGVRTKSQQLTAATNFGLQHYPNGPLASNHVEGHRGAIDVSQPDQLEAILRKYPGKVNLRRKMADDPVHFSPTGY